MSVSDAVVDPLSAWADDGAWARKLRADAETIAHVLPLGLVEVHQAVVRRARAAGANALILSGSTVRGCRTEISDVDYHLVGPKIGTRDLSRELDLHVLSQEKLESQVLAGDDFVQWSLRFGCVILDDGTVRRALRAIAERRPWPDAARKAAHATKSLELAARFVSTGDHDGSVVQVRTALSLTARAHLLRVGIFPLARAEIVDQLDAVGESRLARDLAHTIYDAPPLADLEAAVRRGAELLAGRSAAG